MEYKFEQIDLTQLGHREAMIQVTGWSGWNFYEASGHPNPDEEAFLAFDETNEVAGLGVVKKLVVKPEKVIIGAWSVNPNTVSEFAAAEGLTDYIVRMTDDEGMPGSEVVTFYVSDQPLSATVARLSNMDPLA